MAPVARHVRAGPVEPANNGLQLTVRSAPQLRPPAVRRTRPQGAGRRRMRPGLPRVLPLAFYAVFGARFDPPR